MAFWNFKEDPNNDEEVELRVEGEIIDDDFAWLYELFGIPAASPNAFREALAGYKGKNITVWINSNGGDVFAGAGIYTALKEHQGKVTVKVERAISAASVIAMAGDEIKMSPVGIMMIHNPWGDFRGEAKDMRHAANVLDEVKETIVNAYLIKSKRPRNEISKMMDDETWMGAQKAVSEGFADGILYTENEAENSVQNSFIFSRMSFQNSVADSMKRFFEQCNIRFKEEPSPVPKQKETQTSNDEGLLSLYKSQIQINKNKVRG